MAKIEVQAEFIIEFKSKSEWVNNCPKCLPFKPAGEEWIWLDKNGNTLTNGMDFMAAEKALTFPVKVFRTKRVSEVN